MILKRKEHLPVLFLKVFFSVKGLFSQPLFLWTWRESNPRPKALSSKLLPSQSLYEHSLLHTPKDRLMDSVASWILLLPQSLRRKVPHNS
jgi:hypothetical protein